MHLKETWTVFQSFSILNYSKKRLLLVFTVLRFLIMLKKYNRFVMKYNEGQKPKTCFEAVALLINTNFIFI